MKAPRPLLLGLLLVAVALVAARVRPRMPGAGTSQRRLVVDGVGRTYLLHAGGAAKAGRPLVLVLHGFGGTAADMERRTRATFDALADRDGAVVAYPEALGSPRRWTDGWSGAPGAALPDDVRFLSTLIDTLAAELGIDHRRVFAAGLSNGSSMVYRLACERPDLVAAIAPVSGGMPPDVAKPCAAGAPVSVIAMHGTDDPMVPFVQSTDAVTTWTKRDACPATQRASRLPDTDPEDGTATRVDAYGPCEDGTEVAFYVIEGGGHAWPGGRTPWRFGNRGRTPRDFDAALVAWDFFQRHPRR